jgi:hypothetical protein
MGRWDAGTSITYSPATATRQIAIPHPRHEKGDQCVGLAKCEEVEIVDGKLHIIRHLNGDQTHQGHHVRIPVGAFQIQHCNYTDTDENYEER